MRAQERRRTRAKSGISTWINSSSAPSATYFREPALAHIVAILRRPGHVQEWPTRGVPLAEAPSEAVPVLAGCGRAEELQSPCRPRASYPSLTVYRHRLDGADNGTSYPELRIRGYPDMFIGSNTADWSVNLRIDGATYFSSDRRRKVNIEAVPNALTRVLALRGTHFNTITPAGTIEVNRNSMAPDGRRMGFIAQEVAQVVPEAVNYYAEADRPNAVGFADAYSVDYGALTALLVEAVKGLDSQNRELRQEAARCTQASASATSLAGHLESSLKAQQKKIDTQQARLELQEAQIARLEALVAKLGAR